MVYITVLCVQVMERCLLMFTTSLGEMPYLQMPLAKVVNNIQHMHIIMYMSVHIVAMNVHIHTYKKNSLSNLQIYPRKAKYIEYVV